MRRWIYTNFERSRLFRLGYVLFFLVVHSVWILVMPFLTDPGILAVVVLFLWTFGVAVLMAWLSTPME